MSIIKNALAPFTGALLGSAGSKILEPILTSYNNWFYYTFGYKQDLNKQLREYDVTETIEQYKKENISLLNPIFSEDDLKKFKIEIADELKKIEVSNLTVPDKTKLGLFFENSKFFISEEEIRKAYAKLISQTADKTKENFVHKSFGRVLSELAPDDLKVLSHFKDSNINVFEHYSYNVLGRRKKMDFKDILYWNSFRPKSLDIVPSSDFEGWFSTVMHFENNELNHPLIYLDKEADYDNGDIEDFLLLENYPFLDFNISLSILERLNLINYNLVDKNISHRNELFDDVISQQDKIPLEYAKPNYDPEQHYNEIGIFIVDSNTESILPSFYELENSHYLFEINPICKEYTLTNFGNHFFNIIS